MKLLVIIAASFTFFILGCKKYEDGPRMSLYTKKERLSEKWKVDSAVQIDQITGEEIDITNQFEKETFLFEKNKNYKIVTFSDDDSKYAIEYGTWEFSPKKTGIILKGIHEEFNADTKAKLSEETISKDITITKLLSDDLGLSYEMDDNKTYRLALSPKD